MFFAFAFSTDDDDENIQTNCWRSFSSMFSRLQHPLWRHRFSSAGFIFFYINKTFSRFFKSKLLLNFTTLYSWIASVKGKNLRFTNSKKKLTHKIVLIKNEFNVKLNATKTLTEMKKKIINKGFSLVNVFCCFLQCFMRATKKIGGKIRWSMAKMPHWFSSFNYFLY